MVGDVLIVDNDERIVELVAWFLRKRGYHVRAASDFSLARRCIAERAPDLMLSDLDLGQQNALDELPAMEAEGCLPPTLVVSGYLDQDARERLQRVRGVLGTLAKPFDFPVLEEQVAQCLARAATDAERAAQQSIAGPRTEIGGEVGGEVEDEQGWIEITPRAPSAAARAPRGEPARDPDPLRGAR